LLLSDSMRREIRLDLRFWTECNGYGAVDFKCFNVCTERMLAQSFDSLFKFASVPLVGFQMPTMPAMTPKDVLDAKDGCLARIQ
jgi:hypothetical protein